MALARAKGRGSAAAAGAVAPAPALVPRHGGDSGPERNPNPMRENRIDGEREREKKKYYYKKKMIFSAKELWREELKLWVFVAEIKKRKSENKINKPNLEGFYCLCTSLGRPQ